MGKLVIGIILVVMGLVVPTICVVKSVQFKQECSGYLKQAADASTVEIALDRVKKALVYIEEHKLTEGYTSVLWRTEDENIGFWYQNIKACKEELENGIGGTQLEQTNLLMKVRETLTDNGNYGTELTIPDGISRYPHNTLYGILNCVSLIFFFAVGVTLFFMGLDDLR